jgi:acyl carrier protein
VTTGDDQLLAALGDHPDIVEAVIIHADPPGSERIAVFQPRSYLNGTEVRQFLAGSTTLPDAFLAVPSVWRHADGTPDRARLLDRFAAGLGRYRFVPPRDGLERRLAALWREVLDSAEVGATDDFIELGGDSLAAVGVVARIREELGVEVGLDELFEAATVRRLAEAIAMRPVG